MKKINKIGKGPSVRSAVSVFRVMEAVYQVRKAQSQN